jgi:hypothetical protein
MQETGRWLEIITTGASAQAAQPLAMALLEYVDELFKGMHSIDEIFNFIEGGKHALVNLNPHFALEPTHTRMMPLFVHAVDGRDKFCAHVLLRNG